MFSIQQSLKPAVLVDDYDGGNLSPSICRSVALSPRGQRASKLPYNFKSLSNHNQQTDQINKIWQQLKDLLAVIPYGGTIQSFASLYNICEREDAKYINSSLHNLLYKLRLILNNMPPEILKEYVSDHNGYLIWLIEDASSVCKNNPKTPLSNFLKAVLVQLDILATRILDNNECSVEFMEALKDFDRYWTFFKAQYQDKKAPLHERRPDTQFFDKHYMCYQSHSYFPETAEALSCWPEEFQNRIIQSYKKCMERSLTGLLNTPKFIKANHLVKQIEKSAQDKDSLISRILSLHILKAAQRTLNEEYVGFQFGHALYIKDNACPSLLSQRYKSLIELKALIKDFQSNNENLDILIEGLYDGTQIEPKQMSSRGKIVWSKVEQIVYEWKTNIEITTKGEILDNTFYTLSVNPSSKGDLGKISCINDLKINQNESNLLDEADFINI
ncbi:MAG: hypothetical protein K0S74_467 [Chlamydiales bacterium]|jgi:hypothetical protein|nr:hypothetical protein [Chlamydiales bacterium]